MAVNKESYSSLTSELKESGAVLVAVSKTKPASAIMELYEMGHRDFGENYVQELVEKAAQLPDDIRWHFIGHLQTNKVKYIAPFVFLIHSVDSEKLLREINKQAIRFHRTIQVLLQVHIAAEETKFGLDAAELKTLIENNEVAGLTNVRITGLMGMASFTAEKQTVQKEFRQLKSLFDTYAKKAAHGEPWRILSMGMSGDYKTALEQGSTMVRIGSTLFGERKQIN